MRSGRLARGGLLFSCAALPDAGPGHALGLSHQSRELEPPREVQPFPCPNERVERSYADAMIQGAEKHMTEPKTGDLVAIYVRAEFHNQQEATSALAPKIYEVLEIEESVAVLLETESKDIGKEIYDYNRGSGRRNETKMPIIILREVVKIVPLSQNIIGACHRGAVIARG
jgi:hypothetical protein